MRAAKHSTNWATSLSLKPVRFTEDRNFEEWEHRLPPANTDEVVPGRKQGTLFSIQWGRHRTTQNSPWTTFSWDSRRSYQPPPVGPGESAALPQSDGPGFAGTVSPAGEQCWGCGEALDCTSNCLFRSWCATLACFSSSLDHTQNEDSSFSPDRVF